MPSSWLCFLEVFADCIDPILPEGLKTVGRIKKRKPPTCRVVVNSLRLRERNLFPLENSRAYGLQLPAQVANERVEWFDSFFYYGTKPHDREKVTREAAALG
ncbi:hypothetical protein TNCV_4310601 [Trichonephila clavipes]|nr:hypothetical protein TNCV_4310601 [Trichonephila clavipes]